MLTKKLYPVKLWRGVGGGTSSSSSVNFTKRRIDSQKQSGLKVSKPNMKAGKWA